MRFRIRYSKQGLMKFIGHLDMMRYFQKALRQAGVEVSFTEGMSPHMSMSYAFPLGVGMTSDSEYVDVDLDIPLSSMELVGRLNRAAAEGVHFLDARVVEPGKANKGMNLVRRADYTLYFREGYEWEDGWKEDFAGWLDQESIMVLKKSKKTEKEVNIRPLIYAFDLNPDMRCVRGICDETAEEGADPTASDYDAPGDLFLALSAGSENNIRPELVMEAYASASGRAFSPYSFQINRDEVYTKSGDHFIPLIKLGKQL